jgi:hypothetical protein
VYVLPAFDQFPPLNGTPSFNDTVPAADAAIFSLNVIATSPAMPTSVAPFTGTTDETVGGESLKGVSFRISVH